MALIRLNPRVASIVVICFFGIAVAVVFIAICLLARLCTKAARSVHRKLTVDYRDCPNEVPHTKRVYEIQAEEGVYCPPPDPPEYEEMESVIPNKGSLKELRCVDEEKNEDKKEGKGKIEEKKDNVPSVSSRQRERAIHKDSVCTNLNPFKNKLKQLPDMV